MELTVLEGKEDEQALRVDVISFRTDQMEGAFLNAKHGTTREP